MTTKVNNSVSSNLDEKEEDYIEKEFIKENIEELPIPKKGLEKYEKEILEVMKCGCNRQIAEYVILEYTLEEKEKEKEKQKQKEKEKEKEKEKKEEKEKEKEKGKEKKLLWELREIYENYLNPIIEKTINDLQNNPSNIEKSNEEFLEGYENEIEEILENETIEELIEKDNSLMDNIENNICFLLKKNIDSKTEEEKKKFYSARKEYIEKKEAVIEAALKLVKKIVNDDKEYKKFYEAFDKTKEN